jgi:hypothetical protein
MTLKATLVAVPELASEGRDAAAAHARWWYRSAAPGARTRGSTGPPIRAGCVSYRDATTARARQVPKGETFLAPYVAAAPEMRSGEIYEIYRHLAPELL